MKKLTLILAFLPLMLFAQPETGVQNSDNGNIVSVEDVPGDNSTKLIAQVDPEGEDPGEVVTEDETTEVVDSNLAQVKALAEELASLGISVKDLVDTYKEQNEGKLPPLQFLIWVIVGGFIGMLITQGTKVVKQASEFFRGISTNQIVALVSYAVAAVLEGVANGWGTWNVESVTQYAVGIYGSAIVIFNILRGFGIVGKKTGATA